MENKTRIEYLIDQLRKQCLRKGVGGIKELSVVFRHMDTDFSKRLCFQEFAEGIRIFGLNVNKLDLELMFHEFDRDRDGHIDFLEFLASLRPSMPMCRVSVVNEAFDCLDVIKDDVLKLDDLRIVYSSNARRHPKFVSGEWSEEEVLRNFLDSIDTPGNPDGKVTREEFLNYYAGVSATVDDDSYFDLTMRACYGLPNKGASRNNTK